MPRARRIAVLAAALLSSAACASRSGTLASLLSDRPHRDTRCRVSDVPQVLPSAAQVVDSADLGPEVEGAWRAAGSPAGYVLLSLRFGRDGLNVRRAVLETTVARPLADSVQKLVFANRRSVRPASQEWGVRMRIDMAEQPTMRVGRWEMCLPEPRDRYQLDAFQQWDVRTEMPAPDPMGLAWVRVRLDPLGNVTDARIERSIVLLGRLEPRILAFARSLSFLPATEDGYPVSAETSIAIPIVR
jgi:hypothetical protein